MVQFLDLSKVHDRDLQQHQLQSAKYKERRPVSKCGLAGELSQVGRQSAASWTVKNGSRAKDEGNTTKLWTIAVTVGENMFRLCQSVRCSTLNLSFMSSLRECLANGAVGLQR